MIDAKRKEIEAIVLAIRRIHQAMGMDAARTGRDFGLTGSQGAVLRLLAADGALSSAEVSRRLGVTPSNVTGLIDRLEGKGLVNRSPSRRDRRIVRIALTEAGRNLEHRLPDTIQRKLGRNLERLPEAEVRRIRDALRELLALMEPATDPDPDEAS
jgi:MarR family transcriptional regulator, organic hydroperoxide resistance regulator